MVMGSLKLVSHGGISVPSQRGCDGDESRPPFFVSELAINLIRWSLTSCWAAAARQSDAQ